MYSKQIDESMRQRFDENNWYCPEIRPYRKLMEFHLRNIDFMNCCGGGAPGARAMAKKISTADALLDVYDKN